MVILWPERTERGRYQEGRRPLGALGLSRLGENPTSHSRSRGQGLDCPSWGHWSHQGQKELTYLPTKEEGGDLWRVFAAQRAGALLRTGYKENGDVPYPPDNSEQ